MRSPSNFREILSSNCSCALCALSPTTKQKSPSSPHHRHHHYQRQKQKKTQTVSSNVIHTVTDQKREKNILLLLLILLFIISNILIVSDQIYILTVIKWFFLHSFVSLTTEVGWPASHDWTFFLVICYKLTNLGTFRTIVNFQDLPSNLPLQRNKETKISLRFNFGNQSLKLSFFLANFQQKVTLELINPIRRILLNSDVDLENTRDKFLF